MAHPTSPPRFLVITSPRTASNLLFRVLNINSQPNVLAREEGGYFFYPATMQKFLTGVNEKPISQWSPDERQNIQQVQQACADDMVQHVSTAASEGKIVFVKEHSNFMREPVSASQFLHGNETHVVEPPWVVSIPEPNLSTGLASSAQEPRSSSHENAYPDHFLRTFRLIFLIRHPALTIPSFHRALIDVAGAETAGKSHAEATIGMSLHWTRALYNWSLAEKEAGSPWPIVIDADQFIGDPAVLRYLCDITGLDASKIRHEWPEAGEEELEKKDFVMKQMLSTLSNSTGLQRDKVAGDLDIGVESAKWREEFGDVVGGALEKRAREAMVDYEFLKERMLVVPQEVGGAGKL